MKCKSCTGDVLVTWTAALAKNECPFCGEKILQQEELEFILSLKEALQKMDANPEQIAFWLFENYHLKKIGTGEPVEFKSKKQKVISTNQIDNFDEENDESEIFVPAKAKIKIPQSLINLSNKIQSGDMTIQNGIIKDPIAFENSMNNESNEMVEIEESNHDEEVTFKVKPLTGAGSFRRAK